MSAEQSGDSYNRGGLFAFIFSMVFSLSFFVYISFMHSGVDLKEIPESAATVGQDAGKDGASSAVKAVDVSGIKNPWISSPDLVTHGQKAYQTNCAVCHGAGGLGDGPAGAALVPPPRNLVEGKWKLGGTSVDLFKVLQLGIPGSSMAAFPHIAVVDRWAIVHFIRSITKNKPEDNLDELEKFGAGAK